MIEQGWKVFLVKVINEVESTSSLRITSPQAERAYDPPAPKPGTPETLPQSERWLGLELFTKPPLPPIEPEKEVLLLSAPKNVKYR